MYALFHSIVSSFLAGDSTADPCEISTMRREVGSHTKSKIHGKSYVTVQLVVAKSAVNGGIKCWFVLHVFMFLKQDFDASVSRTEYDDYYQSDKVREDRGHQYAGVFLQRASGLDKVISWRPRISLAENPVLSKW